jgi:hypothetical protein
MLMNRFCTLALFLLLALPACQMGPDIHEFEVEPGVRAITVHANTILEVPDDDGVIQELQCYKIVHAYKLEIEFWLDENGSNLEKSVTAYATSNNTAQDIAGEIARQINAASGGELAHAAETSLTNFNQSKEGRMATEDVLLHEAVQLKRIKITRIEREWREDYSGRTFMQIFLNR